MSLPELCIRRPVMTSLLMLSFIVFGLFGGQTKSRLRMMTRGLLDSLRARTGGLGR